VGDENDGIGKVPMVRGVDARAKGDAKDARVDTAAGVGKGDGGGMSAGTAGAEASVGTGAPVAVVVVVVVVAVAVGIPVGMCVTSCDMTNDNCCNCSDACATR
jgi:hypothetical protein